MPDTAFVVILILLAIVVLYLFARLLLRDRGAVLPRMVAFGFDVTILGLFPYLASLELWDGMVAIGDGGLAIGFVLFVLYFGLLDSGAGGGATVGKLLFGLRVVDAERSSLSVIGSTMRAIILALPVFAMNLSARHYFSDPYTSEIASSIWSLIVFGIGGVIVYLTWFAHDGEQGLHDFAVGAYVVRARAPDLPPAGLSFGHVVTAIAIFALALAVPSLPMALFANWEPSRTVIYFPWLIERAVISDSDLIINGYFVEFAPGLSTLEVDVRVLDASRDLDSVARSVAARVLALSPEAAGYQNLSVSVSRGWNFGVATGERGRVHNGTIADWRAGRESAASYSEVHAGAFSFTGQGDWSFDPG